MNIVADALSRKTSGSIAHMITKHHHLLEDLRRMNIKVHIRGSGEKLPGLVSNLLWLRGLRKLGIMK